MKSEPVYAKFIHGDGYTHELESGGEVGVFPATHADTKALHYTIYLRHANGSEHTFALTPEALFGLVSCTAKLIKVEDYAQLNT